MFKKILKLGFFIFLFSLFTTNVNASEYGTGSKCLSFTIDTKGFPVNSITVDGYPWVDNDNNGGTTVHSYYTNNDNHEIIVMYFHE